VVDEQRAMEGGWRAVDEVAGQWMGAVGGGWAALPFPCRSDLSSDPAPPSGAVCARCVATRETRIGAIRRGLP
jgi:hypothetical protein